MQSTFVIYGLGSIYLIGLIKGFFKAHEFEIMKENILDSNISLEEEFKKQIDEITELHASH